MRNKIGDGHWRGKLIVYLCVCLYELGYLYRRQTNALTNICFFFIWDCNIDELLNITVCTIYLYFYCM